VMRPITDSVERFWLLLNQQNRSISLF
jgi:hypothetical protein